AAVAAGGLDVVDAEFQGAEDGGLEVALAGFLDGLRIDVAPGLLVAHAAAGEDGHLEIGASEPAILHRGIYMAGKPRDNDDCERMRKVSPALLVATVLAAVWLAGTRALAEPVTDPTSSSAADSVDRVAAARLQHGAAI